MSLQASNQEIILVATAGLGIGVVLGALWSPLPDATLTARLCRLQQRLLASVGLASVPANGVLSSSSSINGTFYCATALGMLFLFFSLPRTPQKRALLAKNLALRTAFIMVCTITHISHEFYYIRANIFADQFVPGVPGIDLPPGTDSATLRNWKLIIVARNDVIDDPGAFANESSITVLQHFKKLYKRRDPVLKLWEGGRHRMEVRSASSEDVLAAVYAAAKKAGLPTHTFAGRAPGQQQSVAGKDRRLMVVGPAEKERLHEIVGRLQEL
jgi:peptidyl-tRNA hydrolase